MEATNILRSWEQCKGKLRRLGFRGLQHVRFEGTNVDVAASAGNEGIDESRKTSRPDPPAQVRRTTGLAGAPSRAGRRRPQPRRLWLRCWPSPGVSSVRRARTGGWRRARTGAGLLFPRCPGSRMWMRRRVRPRRGPLLRVLGRGCEHDWRGPASGTGGEP
jgi:hypothetical protein